MFLFNKKKSDFNSEKTLADLNNKWQAIALQTEPVKSQIVQKNLKNIYKELGYKEPQFVFYQSPYMIWDHILNLCFHNITQDKINAIETFCQKKIRKANQGFLQELVCQIVTFFKKELDSQLGIALKGKIDTFFLEELQNNRSKQTQIQLNNSQFELGLNQVIVQLETHLNNQLLISTLEKIRGKVETNLINKAFKQIKASLLENKSSQLLSSLGSLLGKSLFSRFSIAPELWTLQAIKIEYNEARSEPIISSKKWQLLQEFLTNSGWILPYENICFISDRPVEFNLNNQYNLHAEGKFAIKFADNNGFYAYEGVIIPHKYGELKAENWQSKWLLEERNAELRRVLIQGLGYDRIANELEAEEIDSWREYTILRFSKIIDHIDEQPICLLKMTCPSTNFIHALRIPPEFNSAKEAIKWINWGVDPEDIIMAS